MSAIPAVKAALVTQLAALFPSAQVTYGDPVKATAEDIVAVKGARSVEVADSLTAAVREGIEVDVVFSVWRGRGTQQVATERAYEMYDAWRAAVADDRTIGGACQAAEVALSNSLDEAMTDAGPVAEVATTVRLFAVYQP